MKIIINFTLLLIVSTATLAQNMFKKDQLKFERVRNAYDQKWPDLKQELQKLNFKEKFQLYIAAFKSEGKVELWLKGESESRFKLFKTYDFCAHSGTLGPKVYEGDRQTPEGFYKINVFNPMSNFYLSLGIDYPNNVDLARTGKGNKPGNDIYIHGNCVTVGCIPLTDEKIKEVYIIGVEARNAGQQDIPVNIFPFRMNAANMEKFSVLYPSKTEFWKTLQRGYKYFEKNKILPLVNMKDGSYIIM